MLRRRDHHGDRYPDHPSEPGFRETLGAEMTVLARGARLEGTLVSVESIRIDGEAQGKIAARGDAILSSHSHVEADIRAQNVVSGGTLKGNITARTKTELAEGGRVEGTIRAKVLVVGEGALFSGQANIDVDEGADGADGSAFPEDELMTDYAEAARRAADWYRASLANLAGANADGSTPDPVDEGLSSLA